MKKKTQKGGVGGWMDTNLTADVVGLAANGMLKFVTLIFISPYKVFLPMITLLKNPLRRKYVSLVWAILACVIIVTTSVIGFFIDTFNPTSWLMAIAIDSLVIFVLNSTIKPSKIKAVQVTMNYGRAIAQDGDYIGNLWNIIKHHGKIDLNIDNMKSIEVEPESKQIPEEPEQDDTQTSSEQKGLDNSKDVDAHKKPGSSKDSDMFNDLDDLDDFDVFEEPPSILSLDNISKEDVQIDLGGLDDLVNLGNSLMHSPAKDVTSTPLSNSVNSGIGVFDDDEEEVIPVPTLPLQKPATNNIGVFDDDDDE